MPEPSRSSFSPDPETDLDGVQRLPPCAVRLPVALSLRILVNAPFHVSMHSGYCLSRNLMRFYKSHMFSCILAFFSLFWWGLAGFTGVHRLWQLFLAFPRLFTRVSGFRALQSLSHPQEGWLVLQFSKHSNSDACLLVWHGSLQSGRCLLMFDPLLAVSMHSSCWCHG